MNSQKVIAAVKYAMPHGVVQQVFRSQAVKLEAALPARARWRLPSIRILIVSLRAKWRAFFAMPAWAERVEDQEEDFYAWQDSAD